MRLEKVYTTDILLNAVLPLLLGSIPYFIHTGLPAVITGHLADGLWAYAFTSVVLVIWGRRLHWFWLSACLLTAILFEACQYVGFIQGQGDILDLLTYFIFFATALLLNNCFKLKYTTPHT